ncbi:DUF5362 family protein [Niabella hibiscisoli]|uniref:DUF5362 family protein n=1 Tax=Niabella hibiscisoli TaxID=1825928 RepID=UPI001F0EFF7A|nr:DUF5362 family protein [Niabella hibiscisoli]MCH5717641.1 DUF5362 domain-containing protein [Niabella hibiscisoli]
MENSNIFNENGLLDQNGKINLDEAGKWSRFLGIVGFVILGIMLIFGLFAGSLLSGLMAASGTPFASFGATFFTVYMIVVCAIAFYPTFMLYKFGSAVRASIRTSDAAGFNQSLLYLKRYFKFVGIFTIIILGLYALIFIFSALGSVVGR